MNSRLLAIEWTLAHESLTRDGFFDAPSFSSYDAVLIDPQSIAGHWASVGIDGSGDRRTHRGHDLGLGRAVSVIMARRRREASDLLLKAGGTLVCRLRPRSWPLHILSDDGPSERIDRYSWLPSVSLVDRQHHLAFPANGRFVPRRGTDVRFSGTDSPFETFLKRMEGNLEYEAVYQDLLETPIEHFATVLARNRIGDVIAVEIPYGEGRLVLVPPTKDVSPASEAAALVEALAKSGARSGFEGAPDWIASYETPGESALRDELTSLTSRRDKLSAKIEEAQKRYDDTTRMKRLLCAQSQGALTQAGEDACRALGFETEQTRDGLVLRSDQGDARMMFAASESAVDVQPYRRLLGLIDRARTENVEPKKGILVVNGFRHLDPRQRSTEYSDAVRRGCKSQGFCLMNSHDLFQLATQDSGSSREQAALRKRILETDGVFKLAKS